MSEQTGKILVRPRSDREVTPIWLASLAMFVTLLSTARPAFAQWEASQFAMPGPNEWVTAVAELDDGTGPAIYVGGWFDAVDGVNAPRVARLRNGVWEPLGDEMAVAPRIRSFATYNGSIIAGGDFEEPQSPGNGVSRWNGSNWVPLGGGVYGGDSPEVFAILEFEGQLIVAGSFEQAGGTTALNIARWNGGEWSPMADGLNGVVRSLQVFQGALIAGGNYSSSGKQLISSVARWNGASWQPVSSEPLANGVGALAVHNQQLVARHESTIVRLVGDSWQQMGAALNGALGSLCAHNDELFVGGRVTVSANMPYNGLFRWNGSEWEPVAASMLVDAGSSTGIYALASAASGPQPGLIAGGYFSILGQTPANNLALLALNGWTRVTECPSCMGLSGLVREMVVHNDGGGARLFVGGTFRAAGSLRVNGIASWDGSTWSPCGTGFDGPSQTGGTRNGRVDSMAIFDGGLGGGPSLYAAGIFSTAGGVGANNIARWNGTAWSPLGAGLNGQVLAMTVFDDGAGSALYVGGNFTMAGGATALKLAKWNGVSWSTVGGGVSMSNGGGSVVTTLTPWNDGSGMGLVVGGNFDTAGTTRVSSLAYWKDGQWSGIGGGVGGYLLSVCTWPEGTGTDLVCAGQFQTAGTSAALAGR